MIKKEKLFEFKKVQHKEKKERSWCACNIKHYVQFYLDNREKLQSDLSKGEIITVRTEIIM